MTVVFNKEGQTMSTEVHKGDLNDQEATIEVANELALIDA